MIAIQLIVFGALLGLRRSDAPAAPAAAGRGCATAGYIGLAQVLALAPGTSRSGITITAARWLGLDRDGAARFSFLLLIPVVAGATLFKGASAGPRRPALRRRRPDDRRHDRRRRLRLPGDLLPAAPGQDRRATGPSSTTATLAGVAILLIIAIGLRPATF